MAKGVYIGNSNAKKVKKMYLGNGTSHKVKKGYIGVNDVAKLFWSSEYVWKKYNSIATTTYIWNQYNINTKYTYNEYEVNDELDNYDGYTPSNMGGKDDMYICNRSGRTITLHSCPRAPDINDVTYSGTTITSLNTSVLATVTPDEEYHANMNRDYWFLGTVTSVDKYASYANFNISPSSTIATSIEWSGSSATTSINEYKIVTNRELIRQVSTYSSTQYPNGGMQNGYYYELKDTEKQQGAFRGAVTSERSTTYPQNGVLGNYWYVYDRQTTSYSQGSYIGTVESDNPSAYPTNGRHTDGYWYVKQSD